MSNPEAISPAGEQSQEQPPRYSVDEVLAHAEAGLLPCPCCEAPLFFDGVVTAPDHGPSAVLSCGSCHFSEI